MATRKKHEGASRKTRALVRGAGGDADLLFGRMVKLMRAKHGISQEKLGERVGTSQPTIAHAESGAFGMAESNLLLYALAMGYANLETFLAAGLRELRRAKGRAEG